MTIPIQMLLILVVLVGGISWAAMGPPTLTHRGSITALLLLLIVPRSLHLRHLLSIVPLSPPLLLLLLLLTQIWLAEGLCQ